MGETKGIIKVESREGTRAEGIVQKQAVVFFCEAVVS